MPGSFDSDKSSSLISSLRRFRFQNRSKSYQPGSSHSSSTTEHTPPSLDSDTPVTSEEPKLVKSKKSDSKAKHKQSNSTPKQKSSSAPESPTASKSFQKYSPLSYRKYEVSNSSYFLLQCILTKIQVAFRNISAHSLVLELKLTPEELKRLKEVLLQHSQLSQKWASHATEDPTVVSNSEKVVKISREYLKELLKYVKGIYSNTILTGSSTSAEQSLDKKKPVRTYSRTVTKEKIPVLLPTQENHDSNIRSNISDLNQVPAGLHQGIMDEYEVFCGKEQNLRKMLDAFPGADIMEAQDILVRCDWDLKKAMKIASDRPLRTTRKRSFSSIGNSSTETTNSQQNQNMLGNFQGIGSSGSSHTAQKVAEEIVLDSSDEEGIQIKPKIVKDKNIPSTSGNSASKRPRRIISSSESDEENSLSPSKNTLVSKGQPSTSKSFQPQLLNSSSTISPSTHNIHKEKTVSVSQSVTIKAVPNSSSNTFEHSGKNLPVSSAIQNLPKGLVITQIQPSNSSATEVTSNSKSLETSVNGNMASVSVVNHKDDDAKTNLANLNCNKSAQLVRIKSLNNSENTKASNSFVNIVPQNKTLSITPVSKSVSINPVTGNNRKVSVASVDTGSIVKVSVDNGSFGKASSANVDNNGSARKESIAHVARASSVELENAKSTPKPKNTKVKRKKYSSEEEDDEEYGNEDIYDSEDSDCESKLTSAHSAVLKFFQESSADELGLIAGCSKKKVEAIMNVRPFSGWTDLVEKLKSDKALSTDLLNGAKKVIDMRNAINKLMTKCQRISLDMEDLVENLKENKESCSDYVSKQPDLLNDRMHLTSYQMLGLNWLLLMHNQEVNGILADEMGLGKTVQAIAFLAYLKEISISGPHLIVVPSSTLDNWKNEFERWWPTVSQIYYHGSQDARRDLRFKILNDEVDEFDVMITSYNMVTSSAEDRNFFKRLEFHYVIFDEAHMLKNMGSQRYQHLMRIRAPRRLLLTGTPLQNNLVELMSLLIFAMPHMFSGKTEHIKQMFSCVTKTDGNKNTYEKDRITHAKRIMKPFVLRRLKKDVLKELPVKQEETRFCSMTEDQLKKYQSLIVTLSEEVKSNKEKDITSSGSGMMMQLRRAANHPLLLRRFYDDSKLVEMANLIVQEPTHTQSVPNLVVEDMSVMSDFEIHKLCKTFKSLQTYCLPDEDILNSGKFKVLSSLLPSMIEEDHRILIFSQFTMVLDIIEDYMHIMGYKYFRLDGQTPVQDRQQMIDNFNNDPDIPIFLLSTRAGGLGINLTSADTVILHDIDFNPYNDKQAEDRCHRVGQLRDVKVIRLISKNTIEEGILQRAKEKLKLERDIHEENETEENDTASVAKLLRDALGLTSKS